LAPMNRIQAGLTIDYLDNNTVCHFSQLKGENT
jgi:hypothetical protein